MVGDKGLRNIAITEDSLLQDYRIFIKRSESEEQGINNGNTLLFTLLQSQLIDQTIFANLFNRATPDLISKALREHYKMKLEAQNASDKMTMDAETEAIKKQNEGIEAQAAMDAQAQQGQMQMFERQHQQEMEQTELKEGAKLERELLKNQLKQ